MGIRSQNNPAASYLDKWVSTGTDAYLWTEPAGLTATGGMISDYTGPAGTIWRCHVFKSSGTLDVSATGVYGNAMEFGVIAGGGGGGCSPGPSSGGRGGGGAGGLRTNYPSPENSWSHTLPSTSMEYPGSGPVSYTVTVGGGGRGTNDGSTASNGGDSSIVHPSLNSGTGIVASGGGGGSGNPGNAAGDGGCGGGAAYDPAGGQTVASPDGLSPTVQGTDGGPGSSPQPGGAGGGGLAGSGQNDGVSHGGGDAGPGMYFLMAGNSPGTIGGQNQGIFYWSSALPAGAAGGMGAGGGGGGGYPNGSGPDGGRSPWGGGGGAPLHGSPGEAATSGTPTTGAGGGGGTGYVDAAGGNGGSGCVLVRYQIAAHNTGTARATGGNVSYYGGKVIHAFTNSGRFVTPSAQNPAGTDITDAEVILVGGGGGGGWDRAGGGGAASVVHVTNLTIPHTGPGYGHGITIGAGGRGGYPGVPDNSGGENAGRWGAGSNFPTPAQNLVANGGGGGGQAYPTSGGDGSPGGSGGGGAGQAPAAGGDAAAPTTSPSTQSPTDPGGKSYQTDGGDGYPGSYPFISGSGGGAGGAGVDGPTTANPYDGVAGGIGIQLPATFQNPAATYGFPGPGGTRFWIAGGGGSGGVDSADGGGGGGGPNASPYAGAGRGGNSPSPDSFLPAMNGTTMSGSGGGGGGNAPNGNRASLGGHGGSGLCLIAYPQ